MKQALTHRLETTRSSLNALCVLQVRIVKAGCLSLMVFAIKVSIVQKGLLHLLKKRVQKVHIWRLMAQKLYLNVSFAIQVFIVRVQTLLLQLFVEKASSQIYLG